jgi:hypothetical protein
LLIEFNNKRSEIEIADKRKSKKTAYDVILSIIEEDMKRKAEAA